MALAFLGAMVLVSCRGAYVPPPKAPPSRLKAVKKEPPRMGFTIQTGAFTQAENAVKLMETLRKQGIEATYFKDRDGLYKVRFGNYKDREDAFSVAAILKSMNVIDDFYVVSPQEYAVSRREIKGVSYLREEIKKTAYAFLGVPYLWGGTSIEEGFDCSGLTMTVYQLNGINLPRTSVEQYREGEPVSKDELEVGDLVFFSTAGRGKVSHVGIYIGNNQFIHAPRRGKRITVERLDNAYFAHNFIGARRYVF
ncbi:MAG TPA: NlpC/P60 family protein [Syntrophales bacterium]|nr:NlpC/P60 family protein [Syntrophales bacterium]HOL59720.1 NlpC/P60 family protein [Syntrophales bacterium]HPO35866.1 NlpC/P60 family protein [Syntrophales bacterium]